MHSVKVGKQRGVHMCSCLQLAHRGLPCRHYFAALLHDQSVQFDVAVLHPRWFTHRLAVRSGHTAAETSSQPVDAERLRTVQHDHGDHRRQNRAALWERPRSESKAEYVSRLLALEASHPPHAAVANVANAVVDVVSG